MPIERGSKNGRITLCSRKVLLHIHHSLNALITTPPATTGVFVQGDQVHIQFVQSEQPSSGQVCALYLLTFLVDPMPL